DLTVGDPGAGGRLRQVTAGVNSRGFSLGYQRDLFDGGVRGHTYRLGFAGGERRLAAGVATALYRGAPGSSGTGWDVGLVYDLTPMLTVGAVVANLGRPVARDSVLRVSYTPAATLRLFNERAVLSADAGLTSEGVDRKSTRLNSSHLVISYAVFCLKKKKKKILELILIY